MRGKELLVGIVSILNKGYLKIINVINNIERGHTKKLQKDVCTAKMQICLGILLALSVFTVQKTTLGPWLPIEHLVKIQIGLDKCVPQNI